jgi:molybdate/tungstate transport system substrate-binding protein
MTCVRPRPIVIGIALVAASLAASACGPPSAGKGTTIMGGATPSKSGRGTATVDYAGSLTGLMQTSLVPAFEKATGYSLVGKGAGSTLIAQGILDGELDPGAFVSVGKKAIKSLWPNRSHFVLTLATDPLVVAYSKSSRYASELDAIRSGRKPLKDLFTLMARPGFRLARTDPTADPQGAFFILMVDLAQRELHLARGTANRILGTSPSNVVGSSSQIVDENSIATDIASGTFDAGSDYLTEAKQFHLDYITLPHTLDFATPADAALYATVSVKLPTGPFPGDLITLDEAYVLPPKGQVRGGAAAQADAAWLAFLLSPKGQDLLGSAGYRLERPVLTLAPGVGSARRALPPAVLAAFHRLGGTVAGP